MEPLTAASAIVGGIALQVSLRVISTLGMFAYLNPYDGCVQNNSVYDYIVVGGGTSGSVVASRLSEDENVRVLLLEAGPNFDIETIYPGLKLYAKGGRIDWNYTALPNDNFLKCSQGDQIYRPSYAKVLGGFSSFDFMIYSQGYDRDYNFWAKLTNESSWSYPNVLRLFKKVERLYDQEIKNSPDAAYHGFNGMVGLIKDHSPANEKYFKAFSQAGMKHVRDLNNDCKLAVTGAIYFISNRTRQNSAQCYLTPVRDRCNLDIVKNIQVTKILFNEEKRAIGVVAVKDNMTYIFRAKREIILAAGAFNTPQLLQLSGIGPKKLLESFKIPAISILPVGLTVFIL